MSRFSLPAILVTAAMLAGCASPVAIVQPSAEPPSALAVTTAPESTGVTAAPATAAAAPDLRPLKQQLESLLKDQDGTYGIFLIDSASGKSVGVNADTVFPTASTFKLPMAMYVLSLVDRGKARLDESIEYQSGDWEEGTGVLQDLEPGTRLTVRKLVELAITQSDNIATNMLLRRFGRENVFAYMKSLGGKVTLYDEEYPGTTPREMARYMQLSQSSKTIKDAKLRQWLADLLTKTAFDDRVAAGVPDGVKVAHKIGTLPGVVNDIAMVYAPNRTFIVSVYSMDVQEETATDVISEIARIAFDFEQELAANPSSRSPAAN